jgi:hypothetical protein
MNFIPITYTAKEKRATASLVLGVFGLGVGLLILGIAVLSVGLRGEGSNWNMLGMIPLLAGLALMLSACLVPLAREDRRLALRSGRILSELKARYGMDFDGGQLAALSYPDSAPTSNFERFGSLRNAQRLSGSRFVESTIYLVWMDGKLQLSESKDGKNFRELRSRELSHV